MFFWYFPHPSRLRAAAVALLTALACLSPGAPARAADAGLTVAFGKSGLAALSYGGVSLLQSGEFRVSGVSRRKWSGESAPADLQGVRVSVDEARREVTRSYSWGAVSCAYTAQADRLDLAIRIENSSELPLDGVFLQLMELKFPACPKGFDGNPRLWHNIGGPTAIVTDYGRGVMALRNEDVGRPLMLGYPWSIGDRKANTTYPVWAYTSRHGMLPASLPFIDRPIYPGGVDRWHVSLRFGPAGTGAEQIAGDLYRKFAEAYPFSLKWEDRRPIGALFLSSAGLNVAKNPRGWLNDKGLDVTTEAGRAQFRERALAWADASVKVLKEMNAQGMILWDPEGQEFPHAISYLGDPRSLPPEMEPVADEFFKRFRDAGLRVGCCVRPQRPMRRAYQEWVDQIEVADPAANLIAKIAAAKKRWGCTLFYVDSNGDPNAPVDAAIFGKVARAHPEVLLIPEHENPLYFACTAPYNELRMGIASTPAPVRRIYPGAFSVLAIADGKMDERHADLVAAVKAGDILLFRGWFNDSFNEKVKRVYEEAARK